MLTKAHIESVVRGALAEDAPWGDITSELAIPETATLATRLVAREPGVFAGGDVVAETFRQVDERVQLADLLADGTRFAAGDTLARIEGPARGVLTGERVALNFAQRMSGIATLTSEFVDAVAHTSARIADTRKTTPGLRALEKHAVRAGGGSNHRFGLSDAIMIKDNHLAALGAIDDATTTAALRRLRAEAGHTVSIIVEIDRLDQLDAVLEAGPTGVLLDNFSTDDLSLAVARVAGRAVTEASGGVHLGSVAAIAETGVDVIAVGLLTHGARALDLGLDAE
ncbi:carboxylating nicotinate-nucleotide diphosphorylase [Leucobacter sp. USHLN153]|uniref:carboxylating nicotinate-nucleotide diphosphorylase n=1 Tax=Leucobacter sp. USHLN153 TaxID=3081268 RepID=UPI003019815E